MFPGSFGFVRFRGFDSERFSRGGIAGVSPFPSLHTTPDEMLKLKKGGVGGGSAYQVSLIRAKVERDTRKSCVSVDLSFCRESLQSLRESSLFLVRSPFAPPLLY